MMNRSLVLAMLIVGTAFAQSGYRITADQVVVDRRAHWQNWNFPPGVLELGSSGDGTTPESAARYQCRRRHRRQLAGASA